MKERPILFSAPMVRAILAGTKTQTRRIMKPQPPSYEDVRALYGDYHLADLKKNGEWRTMGSVWAVRKLLGTECREGRTGEWRCPYGAPGDRLWLRETFALVWPGDGPPEDERKNRVEYRSDTDGVSPPGEWPDDQRADPDCPRWKPSIFMPRWASRITLDVTGVRVERLHAITDDDARAEGVEPYTPPHGHISPDQRVPGPGFDRARLGDQPYRLPYADLWRLINGADSWDANPWVWVVEFKRVQAEAKERAA